MDVLNFITRFHFLSCPVNKVILSYYRAFHVFAQDG